MEGRGRRQLRMAAGKMEIAVALGLMMMMLASQAAAQNNGCSSVMMTLSPCLDYISSKSLLPGFTCCTTLAGVVQSDPRCLCMVLDGSAASFGISINHTRALELPGVCKVQAPPISQCTGVPTPSGTTPPTPTPSSESPATSKEAADAPKGSAESNATSSSRKNAASLMATMIIPTCALLYAF